MQKLDVTDVVTRARRAAETRGLPVDIVGAHHEGGSDYVELLVEVEGCLTEPCRFTLGVFRDLSRAALLDDVADGLARHLELHRHESQGITD